MKKLLSDSFWETFYKEHPEFHGAEKPWKPKLCALLQEKYATYFHDLPGGVKTFNKMMMRLPFDFESLRREDQDFRNRHCFYNNEKAAKLF